MPEMFAEFEQKRIFEVADDNISEVERVIYDLDTGHNDEFEEEDDSEDVELATPKGGIRAERRKVWLDMSHVRNSLQNWKSHLAKMVRHLDELSAAGFRPSMPVIDMYEGERLKSEFSYTKGDALIRWTGMILQDRLCVQIEEFEEKIRACSMRLDGMTIATQWASL
jgi:hypothetical protein